MKLASDVAALLAGLALGGLVGTVSVQRYRRRPRKGICDYCTRAAVQIFRAGRFGRLHRACQLGDHQAASVGAAIRGGYR